MIQTSLYSVNESFLFAVANTQTYWKNKKKPWTNSNVLKIEYVFEKNKIVKLWNTFDKYIVSLKISVREKKENK